MAGTPEACRRNGLKGGRPRGRKTKEERAVALMSKEQAREFVRQKVTEALGPLLEAQVANAQGIKYLVARAKNGKWERIAASELAGVKDGSVVEVWAKDPSVQSFTDLLNRALDKPAERKLEVEVSRAPSSLTDDDLRAALIALVGKL